MVYRHRLSWSRRTRTCNAPRRAIVSLSLAAGSSQRDAGWSAPPHRPIFSNNRPPCSRRRADRAGRRQRQRRAAGRRRRGCSPDAVHVFSDLARVRRLKLAQLRISLDLEEDLLAVLRQDLCDARDALAVAPFSLPSHEPQARRASAPRLWRLDKATGTRRGAKYVILKSKSPTYLDIDGRVGVLELGLSILGRSGLLFRHGGCLFCASGGGRRGGGVGGSRGKTRRASRPRRLPAPPAPLPSIT